jgi:hypothetical protein
MSMSSCYYKKTVREVLSVSGTGKTHTVRPELVEGPELVARAAPRRG